MALKTKKAKAVMAMVVLAMTCILALTAEAATFADDFAAGINPAHYTVVAGAYTIDGTLGDVRMSKPYGPGAWGQLFFNHDVYGDFDISVDYRDAVLAGNRNQIQLNLSFGGQYIANRRENWDGSRYSVWLDPPQSTQGVNGTADTAGTLRVTRVGSTVSCYANSTLIYQGDFNNSPVTDLSLSLQNNGTDDALSVTFDNFSITADGIDCNPSGMVSWWKAEGNANDSVGGNHGRSQGGATFATGKVGQAFSLDGVDDYVELPAGFADFTSGFTVGLWANPTASGNWARFLELGNGSQADNILFLRRQTSNQLAFSVYNGSTLTGTAIAEDAITNGEWHYYAATMDASGHVQLYKDGLPLVMSVESTPVEVPQNVTRSINSIGRSSWPTPPDAYYAGKIDEVAIFNRALSAGEIASIYNAGTTGICEVDSTPDAFSFISQTEMPVSTTIISNPITVSGIGSPSAISIVNGEYSLSTDGGSTWGNWTSTEGVVSLNNQVKVRQTSSASNSTLTTATLTIGGVSGAFDVTTAAADDPNANGLVSWWKAEGNAYDSVGGNHGTSQGGATFAAGKDGQAFNLNGVSQYLQKIAPVAIPVGSSSRTLSAWIRSDGPTDGTKYQTVVGYGTTWINNQTFLLEWGGAGNDRHLYLTGWNSDLAGTTTLEYGQWYHVAATYDGTTVTLYVNGSLDASASLALNTTLNPDGLLIGTSPPNDGWHSYFNGRIDNVAVYNRALSASEVAKLAGVAPDAFSFTAQTGMPLSTSITSNPITVTGTSSPAAISITNGEYSISTDGGGTWSAYSSTIPATVSVNGQVKVRQTSSASNSTLTTATLTIGGVSGAFDVTTAPSGDPNAIGLVSWWKAENNAYDSVGGNHGTPQAGATYTTGQVGQAFSFDGVDDYVNVPYSSSLDLQGSITIAAWINSSNNSSQNRGIAGKAGGYQIFILAGGHLDLGFYNGTWTHLQSSITIPENEWVYVAGTFNSTDGTMQLYINGVPDTSLVTAQRMSANANSLKIGGFGSDGAPFSGRIDEVKILNRALSALEVSTLAGTKPDAFTFVDQTNVGLGTVATSTPDVTVTGITNAAAISIASCTGTNCEYKINSNDWATTAGTVNNGDTVAVRQTSSAGYSTQTDLILNIGGVTDTFSVTTMAIPQHTLTVNKAGTGAGNVTGGGTYNQGTTQQITAIASTGSTFTGWSGDCAGTASPLDVLIDGNKTCTATFTLNQYTLTVNKEGTGSGTVGGGGNYPYQTPIQVTAAAATGSTFTGWSGDCTGTSSPFVILVNSNKTCSATFTLNQYTVSAAAGGNGSLNAGTASPQTVDYNATTHFTFNAATGYHVAGISGCGISYSNTNNAITSRDQTTAPITGDCAVSATFVINSYTLTISKIGAGTVTSNPAGINCSTDCSENYHYGAEVTLFATPIVGGVFTGWSDENCKGAENCTVTMDDDKQITANFKKNYPWLMFLPTITKGIQ